MVGWLRIHRDLQNRLVFVDEVQPDVMERIHQASQGKILEGCGQDTIRRFEMKEEAVQGYSAPSC